jgi:hypothetical protein
MRIREAEARDAEILAQIHVRAWQEAYRGQLTDDYLDGLSVADRAEQWRGSLAHQRETWRTWVAEDGGAVIGWATTGAERGRGRRGSHRRGLRDLPRA